MNSDSPSQSSIIEFINGVDETGRLLSPEVEPGPDLNLSDREQRRLQHWSEFRDALRLPIHGVDPEDLGQSGWAVLWGPDVTSDVREALDPLVSRRLEESKGLGKQLDLGDEVDALTFLEEQSVVAGRVVPTRLPYYLLLVGDPARLPFEFQYRVDVQHAVGRLHFPEADDYAAYAQSVLAAEEEPGNGREARFWGAEIEGDVHSRWMLEELLDPMVAGMEAWQTDRGLYQPSRTSAGTKAALLEELRKPPAFLFTASHGMVFRNGADEERARLQGALLCEDWRPSQGQAPGPEVYLAADDVPSGTDLAGLIACHFACYSAGCSALDPFEKGMMGTGRRQHPHAFISALSQKLLTSGAQAVLGHVDRTWTTTFSF
ncbi:MAG: hypothetical protein KDD47_25305, partial [Acidobacteria bacterium]|nr:hypothetical protein [Acidobacteriota bacterium]